MKRKPEDVLATLLDPQFIAKEVRVLHRWIGSTIKDMPTEAFRKLRFTDTGKALVYVDLQAEHAFRRVLRKVGDVNVVGEESLNKGLDFRSEQRCCALLDMVDGTHLLQRGFSNWCSAIVIFNPAQCRIEGAFVALAERTLYYATGDGAFKGDLSTLADNTGESEVLRIPTRRKALRDATMCMYGQKGNALLRLIELCNERSNFCDFLRQLDSGADFRFYNLAGNPMMVRLAEGTVDLVVELNGQLPHDIVAGAFIAMKAGATLGDAEEHRVFSETDLAKLLYTPAERETSYILAANEELYAEAVNTLSKGRRET